jgi:hypothetical protein
MAVVKSDPTAETDGISPKVAWPAVALAALGVVMVVLHFVLSEDGDTLLTLGLTLVGASGLTGGLGYKAPAALQKKPVV